MPWKVYLLLPPNHPPIISVSHFSQSGYSLLIFLQILLLLPGMLFKKFTEKVSTLQKPSHASFLNFQTMWNHTLICMVIIFGNHSYPHLLFCLSMSHLAIYCMSYKVQDGQSARSKYSVSCQIQVTDCAMNKNHTFTLFLKFEKTKHINGRGRLISWLDEKLKWWEKYE